MSLKIVLFNNVSICSKKQKVRTRKCVIMQTILKEKQEMKESVKAKNRT